ncbi:MAG: hypothetical protein AAGF99_10920 [Bacteroidota bacterium]
MLYRLVQRTGSLGSGTVLLAALLLAVLTPASAQSLPDWAKPAAPQSYESPPSEPLETGGEIPGAPAPVPVDGGLGLLALAGAGYAVRKLRARA